MSFTFGLLLSFALIRVESEVEYVALGRLPGGLTSGLKVNVVIDLLVYFLAEISGFRQISTKSKQK